MPFYALVLGTSGKLSRTQFIGMVRKLLFLLPWHKLCREWIYEVPPDGIVLSSCFLSNRVLQKGSVFFFFFPHWDFDLQESDRTVSVTLGIIKVAFGIPSWN